MNYYDEFGVPFDASADEIRRAYRTLVRLLHPDNQPDQRVKDAAERQMRRLNEMFAVLSDPARRRVYDARNFGLAEPERNRGRVAPPAPELAWGLDRPAWVHAALRNWFWVLTTATVLIALIWYAAAANSGERALTTVAPADSAAAPPSSRAPAPAASDYSSDERRYRRRAAHNTPEPEPDASPASLDEPGWARPAPAPLEPPAPAEAVLEPDPFAGEVRTAAPLPKAAPAPAPAGSRFAGAWLYSPQIPQPQTDKLYPPTYIELLVTERDGMVQGDYRARYRVPEQPISPEVVFRASGRSQPGDSVRLAWSSPEGSKGEVELGIHAPGLMKVTWWTTQFGRSEGLASGTAILMRERR